MAPSGYLLWTPPVSPHGSEGCVLITPGGYRVPYQTGQFVNSFLGATDPNGGSDLRQIAGRGYDFHSVASTACLAAAILAVDEPRLPLLRTAWP